MENYIARYTPMAQLQPVPEQSMLRLPVVNRRINLQKNDLSLSPEIYSIVILSSARPYGHDDVDTPTNIRTLANERVSCIVPLNSQGPENIKRFVRICTENNISIFGCKDFFIKDAFNENELPPEKIDRIVSSLLNKIYQDNERISIFCGAGNGRSGVIKAACLLATFTPETILSNPMKKNFEVVTELNDEFQHKRNKTLAYPLIADVIDTIRESHPAAIERVSDVKVLNNYYEFLVKEYQ